MPFMRWLSEMMLPDHSDRFSANVFAAVISLLIFASVGIVFAATFDLPPSAFAALRRAENVIVLVFTAEYLLRIWTADLSHPDRTQAVCGRRGMIPAGVL